MADSEQESSEMSDSRWGLAEFVGPQKSRLKKTNRVFPGLILCAQLFDGALQQDHFMRDLFCDSSARHCARHGDSGAASVTPPPWRPGGRGGSRSCSSQPRTGGPSSPISRAHRTASESVTCLLLCRRRAQPKLFSIHTERSDKLGASSSTPSSASPQPISLAPTPSTAPSAASSAAAATVPQFADKYEAKDDARNHRLRRSNSVKNVSAALPSPLALVQSATLATHPKEEKRGVPCACSLPTHLTTRAP